MTRPATQPMPLHARRYLDRAEVRTAVPHQPIGKPCLKSRYIARAREIGRTLPRVIDTLFLCLAAIGLIGFFLREELGRWIGLGDQNRADRAASLGGALLLLTFALYLVGIVLDAWLRGDFDGFTW